MRVMKQAGAEVSCDRGFVQGVVSATWVEAKLEASMRFRSSDARLSQGWQHVILVGVSLSLAYLIALLTFMNRWINFWLRGSYYLSYQAIFLTLLLVLFLVRLTPSPYWTVAPWYLNDHFWRSGWICRGLDRVSLASDFPGERHPSSTDNAPIPGTRSGDGVLVVSCETPELALRRRRRNLDSCHQSAVREVLRNAQGQCNQLGRLTCMSGVSGLSLASWLPLCWRSSCS